MKVLYIHQYFKTPEEPGGTRSYWVAQELLKRKHEVTFLTTRPNQAEKIMDTMIDGLRVISFKVPYSQNMGLIQRFKSFTHFMQQATKHGLKQKDIDLVIATSTPLTVGYPALRIKSKLRVPYIFEVRDLWPEVPIQMGVLNNPVLKALAKWFEKKIYRNAAHVVALSPGMQDGVIKYIPATKTSMIPNMAKIDEFWPRSANEELMLSVGLRKESFKVIHFGALGLANGADYIIKAAAILKDLQDVEFVFAGGGSTEDALKAKCVEMRLSNVHFIGKYPMSQISEIVNFCDVSVVTFMDLPILYTNSPNKLFDSLSAGKPIIVNSAGWTKKLVEEERCGYYVDPKNPKELADRILYLKTHPDDANVLGLNSRKLAETKYDKSILCNQFGNLVDSLVSSNV